MKKPFLEAGQIVSTHGVRGDVKVMPWADDPEFLLDFDTVYLGGKPVRVQSCRVQKTCDPARGCGPSRRLRVHRRPHRPARPL